MDKYEYKIRTEEIKSLIAKGEYAEAAEIADGIDWRRVKSVMMLCTISDLYKMNGRYEDSRDLLLLAYDRHPGGRSIVYSLCELSIKMGEFVQAVEYYKEFVQAAPKDNGRYVLQYKLYEAQDVSLEERIEVLEDLKARDYVEKWAYELAYLYHRVGLATKCVEECDELILWFGEGKYVMKAMELKMLHEPLTPAQQEKYDYARNLRRRTVLEEDKTFEVGREGSKMLEAPTLELPSKELDINVKVMGVGQYDTINMQKELAEHMKELWEGAEEIDENGEVSQNTRVAFVRDSRPKQGMTELTVSSEEPGEERVSERILPEAVPAERESVIYGAPQETTAATYFREEDTEEEPEDTLDEFEYAPVDMENTSVAAPDPSEGTEENREKAPAPIAPEPETEVFFGETGDLDNTASQVMEAMRNEASGLVAESYEEDMPGQLSFGMDIGSGDMKEIRTIGEAADLPRTQAEQSEVRTVHRAYDKMLGMEYDGQISMLLPESEQIEKQITGQICLEDVLIEWERMKKESEQKRREAVEQRVLQQTGAMFTEFEAAIRDGLLERLEREKTTEDLVEEAFAEAEEEIDFLAEEPEETRTEQEALCEEKQESFREVRELSEVISEGQPELSEEVFEEAFDEVEELEEIEEIEEPEETEEVEESEEIEEIEEPEEIEEIEEPEETEEIEETEQTEEVAAESGEEVVSLPEEEMSEEVFDQEVEESREEFSEEEEELLQEEEELSQEEEELLQEEEELSQEEEELLQEEEELSQEEEELLKEQEELPESREQSEETQEQPTAKQGARTLSPEEQELFGAYAHNKKSTEQIINAIDKMTMASYTGNVIITGDENMDTLTLAKNLVKEVQSTDSNFSGKIAKISGASLNLKDMEETLDKMANGALLIQKVGGMNKDTASKLHRALQQEERGIIVLLIDTKKAINGFLRQNAALEECFNIRVDVEALSNKALVEYGKKYAREQEYSIDEMGVLALHTAISDRQMTDHVVTVEEVQEIIDEAIRRANRKTLGHFFDILIAKRYDDEDMIVLREKDFV